MKLKFNHPVLLIFSLFSLSAFSQSEPREESTSYEKNVNLLQNIETSKAIVLFENDNFVIQSTIEVLETNLIIGSNGIQI